jgi:hypothetical protein
MEGRKYTREFKSLRPGIWSTAVSVKQTSRDPIVHEDVLHMWVKEFAPDKQNENTSNLPNRALTSFPICEARLRPK